MVGNFLASRLAGKMRRDGVAGRFCYQRPRHSSKTPGPIPSTRQMHIPPWLWFRVISIRYSRLTQELCKGETNG